MSREMYVSSSQSPRSPKPIRREMPQVGQASPSSKGYPSIAQSTPARGSPIGGTSSHHSRALSSPSQARKNRHIGGSRSSNSSPLTLPPEGHVPHSLSSSAFNVTGGGGYYGGGEDLLSSPVMDTRSASATGHHRSRSTTRGNLRSYHSLERDNEREFMPIREPRERSLDRGDPHLHHRARERSLDRLSLRDGGGGGMMMDDDAIYGRDPRTTRQSPNPDLGMRGHGMGSSGGHRDAYIIDLQNQLGDMQKEYSSLKKELDITNQKLGSSMHSIKTFWSPELKKERALRKEESAKYSLINDQLKLLNSENQKQATLIHQLEDELRSHHMRNPDMEMQQQLEQLYGEKQHQAKEIYLLRETIKEMELRIETQKQTLQAREESIKKLLEMLQTKGAGGKLQEDERLEYERMKTQLFEAHARARHLETLVESKDKDFLKTREIEEARLEVQKRDQEILAMGAKMRTLEEQHQDYQRHIAVLKESLCAKEEHYNMLQTDVEELRQRLEEKNKLIEKKTQQALQAQQERNRLNSELNELKDHMDIKDRKINVLQRKVELHDAKEMAIASAKGKEDEAMQRQMMEKQKQLEEMQRAANEKNKQVEENRKKLEEKQKALEEMDKRLKKRKDKIDEMETQMQKAEVGQNEVLARQIAELRKRNQELEKHKESTVKGAESAKMDATRSQAELDRLLDLLKQAEDEKFSKDKQIQDLQTALNNLKRTHQAERSAGAHTVDEARKREEDARKETSKTQTHLQETEERIEELEEALRESVRITAEREVALEEAQRTRASTEERVHKLEERLKSLQNAHNLRCTNCPVTSERLSVIEGTLSTLKAERKNALEELFDMKQEALAAAVSEKDAHIALLEMTGVKNYKTAEELEELKETKKIIMEKMKVESEKRVTMLSEWTNNHDDEYTNPICEDNEISDNE